MAVVTKNVDVAGRRLSIETGRVAEQANGAVILRQGDSVVLTVDLPEPKLRAGDVGTVVLLHGERGYEAEFVALNEETLAVVGPLI